jgi:Zn ribbon nucleic-acid-binding protein
MEIRNCPECAAETVSAGLALWADGDAPVAVVECVEPECGWASVESEWASTALDAGDTILVAA